MSWEFWIGTGTIVIAIGTVILVVYAVRADFGKLKEIVQRASGALRSAVRKAIDRARWQVRCYRLTLAIAFVLTTMWLLFLPLAFASNVQRSSSVWIAVVWLLAVECSLMALILSMHADSHSTVVVNPVSHEIQPFSETAPLAVLPTVAAGNDKRDDLQRRATAMAVALLGYLNNPEVFFVAWEQLKPYNATLDALKEAGVDLDVFAIPQAWTYYANGADEIVVAAGRLVPQLEALVSYLAPLEQPAPRADSIPF